MSGVDTGRLFAYIDALLEALQRDPMLVLQPDVSAPKLASVTAQKDLRPVPVVPSTRRIFLVHGHDEVNLLRLERMLKGYGLQPVILKYEPGKGRTLIEKFEEEAEGCGYAFVLLTPDDLVEYATKDGMKQHAQARPNAIFELGWFYGRIRRERVCILYKRGTELHSDLAGISRIEFGDNVEDKAKEIEQELSAAGIVLRR